MAALNSESMKGKADAVPAGSMTPGDAREILMDRDVGDRKAGKCYIVDSALASHYVDTKKLARYVEAAPAAPAKAEEAGAPNDRTMTAPPRGKGKK